VPATPYAEALEQQVAARRWIGERLRPGAAWTWRGGHRAVLEALWRGLGTADPYYWGAAWCPLVREAARGLPDVVMGRDLLPAAGGYIWFASPLPLDQPDGGPFTWCRAIAWHDLSGVDDQCLVAAFVPTDRRPAGEPIWFRGCGYGRSIFEYVGEVGADGESRGAARGAATARQLAAYFAACLLFLRQRILAAPQERADRAASRRLEREGWTQEPLIRVVQLRRRESAARERDGESVAVDWACRWVVRGHWRQQACGEGRGQRRPIWVLPHVKGPPEKPLKPPRATVFAVVR
jgi:hypothetical protein